MITLLSSKIESEIASHFEENYDITEPQTELEVKFTFSGAKITVPYYLIHDVVSYNNNEIRATKNGASYCTEDREHFQIKRCSHNPNKKGLQQEIDSILERSKFNESLYDYDPDSMKGGRDYENDKKN